VGTLIYGLSASTAKSVSLIAVISLKPGWWGAEELHAYYRQETSQTGAIGVKIVPNIVDSRTKTPKAGQTFPDNAYIQQTSTTDRLYSTPTTKTRYITVPQCPNCRWHLLFQALKSAISFLSTSRAADLSPKSHPGFENLLQDSQVVC